MHGPAITLPFPRALVAWLVALPLVAAGTWLSHCYAFALAAPAEHAHAHASGGVGIGLLCSPAFALTCAALVAGSLGLRAAQGAKPGRAAGLSAWPFAVLAPAGFLLHHLLLHLLGGAPVPPGSLLAPGFLLGLLLQIPLGLVTYRLARLLLRAADLLGRALGEGRRRRVRPAPARTRTTSGGRPRLTALALASAPRAPPLAL